MNILRARCFPALRQFRISKTADDWAGFPPFRVKANRQNASAASKRKRCERSERLKVLGRGFYGIRLGCGVLAAPWANAYGVLAVGENPFTKGFPPLVPTATRRSLGVRRPCFGHSLCVCGIRAALWANTYGILPYTLGEHLRRPCRGASPAGTSSSQHKSTSFPLRYQQSERPEAPAGTSSSQHKIANSILSTVYMKSV